jgi:hypothetical protein
MNSDLPSDKNSTRGPIFPPPLSPHLGFVVQFRVRTGQPESYFAGRVEHMPSGHMAHFHSLEELMQCFVRLLNEDTTRSS